MHPPDVSSHPENLRIGECTVDVLSREIDAPGARRPLRVTPKAMAVLLVLVENVDKVVSRDTLLATVWPDTLPGDDVLTQAVTQLRKAFHEVRGDPQYIETIAKGGYRLLARVEHLDTARSSSLPPVIAPVSSEEPVAALASSTVNVEPVSAIRRPGWHLFAAVFLLVGLVVAGAWWLGRLIAPAAPPDAVAALVPERIEPFLITSAPGFELAPTLSPSGGLVAYMAIPEGQRNIAIMLQTTVPVSPRQLTYPDGLAEDAMPRWSPDGRDIAFLRVNPGHDCRLMLIRATGRAERTVGACDPDDQPSFDWTPDGAGLILDRGGNVGLQVLDLSTGKTRVIDYDANPGDLDTSARYSPDGDWIVFVRNSPLGDFWQIPAEGGKARRLTRLSTEILGWDWTPDSRSLVYASRNDGASRLHRYDIDSGNHADLGVEDGEQPTLARNADALAYVVRHPRFGIYRFAVSGDGQGERLFASSGRDRVPSIAPDGRQLVFVSDRAGPFGLWWGDVDDSGSMRLLTGIQPDTRQPAAWSSDSKRLLLIGSSVQSLSDETVPSVFEVVPDSGRISRLALPAYSPVQASYAPGPQGPDQRLLVLDARADGRLRLNLFPSGDGSEPAIATLDDVVRFQLDAPRGRLLFARLADPGLWQASLDLDPASVRPVEMDGGFVRWHHAWSVAEDGGIYLVRRTPECPAWLIHDPSGTSAGKTDSSDTSPLCLDKARRAATRAFTYNPRTRQIYITLAEYDGGDIGFATFGEAGRASGKRSASH